VLFWDSLNGPQPMARNRRTAKTAHGENTAARRLSGRPISESQNAGADLDRDPKK
jgi:hypothetical protein